MSSPCSRNPHVRCGSFVTVTCRNCEKPSASARRRRPLKTHNDRSGLEAVLSDGGAGSRSRVAVPSASAHHKTRQLAVTEAVRDRGEERRPGKRRFSSTGRYEFCGTRAGFLNYQPKNY